MAGSDLDRIEAERRQAQEALRERDELYRLLTDNANDFIRLHDLDGRSIYASPSVERLYGRVPTDVFEFAHPEDVETCRRWWQQVLAGGKDRLLWRVRDAGGNWRWLETSGSLAPYQGKPHVVAVCRDVSERQRADEALRESQRKLEEAQRVAHVGYWENDLDAGRITWSEETYRILGLSPREGFASATEFRERIHPEDRQLQAEATARAQRGEARYDVEYRVVRPDGEVRTVRSVGDVIRDAEGRPRRAFGVAQDITERRRTEQALRRSERDFYALADNSLQGIAIFQDKKIVYANPAKAAIYGYTVEELKSMSREQLLALVHPTDRAVAEERARKREAGDELSPSIELRILRKDGSTRWVQCFNNPFEFNGQPAVLSTSIDITERKWVEEVLRETTRKLNEAQHIAHVGHWEQDLDTDRIAASDETYRIFGLRPQEDLRTWTEWQDRLHPEDREIHAAAIVQALREGPRYEAEYRVVRPDGETRIVHSQGEVTRDDAGRPRRLFGIVQDITERRHLEGRYLQAQKMEAVGRLAGGVAHDFNNLLTIINGYSDLVLDNMPPDHPDREMLAEVHKAGQRAAALTRQLLAFSRRQVLAPEVVDLNAVVADLQKMLRRVIGEDIDLTTALQPGLGLVKVDPGQVEQVLLNLVVNARDAMPTGGKLSVETRDAELDESYAQAHADVRPGRYVLLAVSDTGHGMTPEVKARIFEPFFTTKEPGKGTGLGLAMIYGFVQQSGGHVQVDSEAGSGTTFRLYLPRVEGPVVPRRSQQGVLPPPRGHETVLLVEDEAAVRSLIRRVLKDNGYTVREAADGDEALRLAEQYGGPIHLLVCDVVMPNLGGRELAERLLARHPEMKVLFLSGYTDDAVVRHGILQESVNFLQKPITSLVLAAKVREVLDSGRENPPNTESR